MIICYWIIFLVLYIFFLCFLGIKKQSRNICITPRLNPSSFQRSGTFDSKEEGYLGNWTEQEQDENTALIARLKIRDFRFFRWFTTYILGISRADFRNFRKTFSLGRFESKMGCFTIYSHHRRWLSWVNRIRVCHLTKPSHSQEMLWKSHSAGVFDP